MTVAVGVDGARGGWVAVTRGAVRGYARFADILADHADGLLMVDIPIGLLATRTGSGDRACDKEARAALRPSVGRVFAPPRRDQLALADRPFRAGLGMSAQTHAILPKIREVDRHRKDPRVREAHPDLAFKLATGRVLPPKRSADGKTARERALRKLGLLSGLRGLGVKAKEDDVNDASILCWLAERALAGEARYYGEPPLVIWGAPASPAGAPHAKARRRDVRECH